MPVSSSNPRRKVMYSPAMTSANTTTKPAMTARVARSLSRIVRASRLTRRPRSLRTSREVEIETLEVGSGRVTGIRARRDGPAQRRKITLDDEAAAAKQPDAIAHGLREGERMRADEDCAAASRKI